MVRRKVRAAARLLVLPQQGPSRPLVNDCVHASSLLPSHARPGTVFLIMGGGLHVVDTGAARPAIAPIAIRPANILLVELLALSKQASPAELIVLVRPATTQRDRGIDNPRDGASPAPLPSAAGTPPPRLWRLVVEGDRATGSPVVNAPWLRSRAAFFERYHAPRCRNDGSDCLMVADGDRGAFLDVQPTPHTPRHEWKKLETGTIHDASWNPADQSSALALVACDEQSP
jgi:hypothetical protein